MKKEEILEKLNEIRKNRILDIYAEQEFNGKGLVVDKNGKTYIYKWYLALSIEQNKAKEVYQLEQYKIDINKIKLDYNFNENKKDNCINIINLENLKIENNDIEIYNKIMEEVEKCLQ